MERQARQAGGAQTIEMRMAESTSAPRLKGCYFTVMKGADVGRVFVLEKTATMLGRSAEADIHIDDTKVSRQHLKIAFVPSGGHNQAQPGVVVADLHSTNGLFINGSRVYEHALRDGDTLQVGETILQFASHDRLDALYDVLTNLPNRALLLDRLERVLTRARRQAQSRFAVLCLTLEHFKPINDSLGHQAGDQLLVELASRLARCVRGSDTVARLGGDAFAILLDDLRDDSDCVQVATRIHQALTQPFILNGQEVCTTGSIGIALSRTGYDRPGDLLRDADIAMYRAKAQGRACSEVFDPAMRSRIVERWQLETALRRALAQHEFLVYYQPIVNLLTGRLAGFEALVRWQHAERGLVAPGEFMPVAEETGLIVPLGRWVLAEACRQMHTWHRQYPTTPALMLSVNLSGRQVVHPGLCDEIQHMLRETALDPHGLQLEMTESVLIEHDRAVTALFASLRALGIQLGIDDFGTGYSSLSYLQRFPIDTLKIDRVFVDKIESEEKAQGLVKTILALAQTLHLETIAEGIETAAHLAALRTLGCPYGQGYLFSRPVASPIAEVLIAQNPQW